MPDRIVRAGILTSENVCALTWGAEVFYRRLLSIVDDFGRQDGRPNILVAALYPLQIDKVTRGDVEGWLDECARNNLVTLYSVEGKPYVQVERFKQRMRAARSKWPAPSDGVQVSGGGDSRADDRGLNGDDGHPHDNVTRAHDKGDDPPADDGHTTDNAGNPPADDGHSRGYTETETETETTQKNSRKKKRPVVYVTVSDLVRAGVSERAATEWLELRISKRARLTLGGWETTQREIAKSGLTPDQAIQKAVARGWQGFESRFLENDGKRSASGRGQSLSERSASDEARASELFDAD